MQKPFIGKWRDGQLDALLDALSELLALIGQGSSRSTFGRTEAIVGMGEPMDHKPDSLEMFKLQHPEVDKTKFIFKVGDKTFSVKRSGLVAKHVIYADLPPEAKNALDLRRQFTEQVMSDIEIGKKASNQKDDLDDYVSSYEEAARAILLGLGGSKARQARSKLILDEDEERIYVSDGFNRFGEPVDESQVVQVQELEAKAEASRSQAEKLDEEIEATEAAVRRNSDAAHKMYELANSILEQHLEAQGHDVLATSASMNDDGTDGFFQVVIRVDEKVGEYPISHLPDELREKLSAPAVTIETAKAPTDASKKAVSSGNGHNIAAQVAAATESDAEKEKTAETSKEESPVDSDQGKHD